MADSARPPSSSTDSLRWLMEAVGESPAGINERIGAGMMVGRYRLVETIGRGGFGMVFKAVDTELGREIALKLLSAQRRGGNADARLMREGQAMARLSHPNVLTIYDVGTFEHGVFIAMELIDGGTLSAWLKEPRRWRQVIDVFLRAGRGLEAAHRAGLVHRDFKPENVLVGRDERVQVTDFGVARMMDGANDAGPAAPPGSPLAVSLTRSGALLGTPAYMSPEQMSGEPSDARADVFSFCVALYEGLYHERPFGGGDLEALRAAIAGDRVALPRQKSAVPARVRRVILRGLRASPDERQQTMGALLLDLQAATRGTNRRYWLAAGGFAGAALVALLAAQLRPHPVTTTTPAALPPPVLPVIAPVVAAPAPSPSPARAKEVVRTNRPPVRRSAPKRVEIVKPPPPAPPVAPTPPAPAPVAPPNPNAAIDPYRAP